MTILDLYFNRRPLPPAFGSFISLESLNARCRRELQNLGGPSASGSIRRFPPDRSGSSGARRARGAAARLSPGNLPRRQSRSARARPGLFGLARKSVRFVLGPVGAARTRGRRGS